MDCPSCGHPNREGARFCAQCAAPLVDTVTCPACGEPQSTQSKFCDACGRALAEAGAPAAPADSVSHTPEHLKEKIRAGRALEGERKQVTVLFADVMGSMELAERSGPEGWRGIMDRFFAILCDGVHRFEGTVDKFTGDGIMALFGAPIAHENHAQRACYAALRLQDELASYAAELRRTEGLNLSVRMGINSGEVVVGAIGDDLEMSYTAIGHTVGLAQRMEQLAEPGGVYVTQASASLAEGFVALRDLGEFQIKGVAQPMRVHVLTGIGPARGRLDVSRARGFSRFVGREEEMRTLELALEAARAGEGQVVGVVGEAGVGKSRLCHEFAQRCRANGIRVYHVSGQAHTQSVPLTPVLQLMRDYFDITEVDYDQTARERIAGKLLLLDERFAEDLPLIFDFLAVPDPERPPPHMDPEARLRQLLGVVKRLIHAESGRDPGVNLYEDLHWLDAATETFLANHIEAVRGTRSLTIVNFRPEYRAEWMSRSYYRQIALVPLGAEAIDEMLGDLLGSDPSLAGLPELVRERTGGNPFFIEEIVQSLVEAGNVVGERGAYRLLRPVEESAVPATVQAVLTARIDRLEPREKAVLQAAAVVGKEFAEPVLRRVVDLKRSELEDALRELVSAEFVYEQELYPDVVYAFKHPLTQEVAYGSQLGERRVGVHAAVARAIAEQYPERLEERAALLAHHWEAAGERLGAAHWHARAGAWTGTNDPTQSLRHWHRVQELTDSLPQSDETAALGLMARIFSLQYMWRLGTSREEAQALFTEAERMASKAGDIRSRAILLSLMAGISGINDGDVQRMATLARQSIALAEESQDPVLYMTIAGSSYGLFNVGETRGAIAVLDRALELAGGDVTVGAGINVACPYAYSLVFKGGYMLYLGQLEEGRDLIERGINLARERGDIETTGWGHMWLAAWCVFAGETDAALRHAQQTLEIAERIGDSFSRAWAWYFLGVAEQLRGDSRGAVEALERSIAIARERRTSLDADAWRLTYLSEAYLGLGDAERAKELIDEARDLAIARGQTHMEIPARVTHSRVLMASGRLADAEATLARALELVRESGMRGLEPGIHVALAELAVESGDDEHREQCLREAHRLYSEMGATAAARELASELAPLHS